jgi:hypothetical protein
VRVLFYALAYPFSLPVAYALHELDVLRTLELLPPTGSVYGCCRHRRNTGVAAAAKSSYFTIVSCRQSIGYNIISMLWIIGTITTVVINWSARQQCSSLNSTSTEEAVRTCVEALSFAESMMLQAVATLFVVLLRRLQIVGPLALLPINTLRHFMRGDHRGAMLTYGLGGTSDVHGATTFLLSNASVQQGVSIYERVVTLTNKHRAIFCEAFAQTLGSDIVARWLAPPSEQVLKAVHSIIDPLIERSAKLSPQTSTQTSDLLLDYGSAERVNSNAPSPILFAGVLGLVYHRIIWINDTKVTKMVR